MICTYSFSFIRTKSDYLRLLCRSWIAIVHSHLLAKQWIVNLWIARSCVRAYVREYDAYVYLCTFVHFISLRSHKHIFGISVCCNERCFQEQLRDCTQPLGE